jgi:hypothetical protein
MFENLMAKLSSDPSDFDPAIRRAHIRREADHCVSVIEGKTYPVENWSPGGVLIHGDSREFGVNDEVDFTIKFKLRDDVIDVPHKAKVIRKSRDKVAFEFLPLTDQIKKSFLSVVDDYMAREFTESQVI